MWMHWSAMLCICKVKVRRVPLLQFSHFIAMHTARYKLAWTHLTVVDASLAWIFNITMRTKIVRKTYPIVRAMLSMHIQSSVDPNSVHWLAIVCNRLIRLCRQYNKILWPPLIAQRCKYKSTVYSTCKIDIEKEKEK